MTAQAQGQPPSGPHGEITLVEGSTFCISEPNGDVLPRSAQGLFVRDVRALSRWELQINGRQLQPLTAEQHDPFSARFASVQRTSTRQPEGTVLALRQRYVGDGMREDVTLRNMSAHPAVVVVSLVFGTDFADLFDVKAGAAIGGWDGSDVLWRTSDHHVELACVRDGHTFRTVVDAGDGGSCRDTEVSWAVRLNPHGEWSTTLQVRSGTDGTLLRPHHAAGAPPAESVPAQRLRDWRSRGPRVATPDIRLIRALQRCVDDIGALRIFDPAHPERAVVAAGAPWFMALFGRDSLLTAWMLLPFDASLAIGTLQTLADRQGREVDADTEEEPGRILHEVRFNASQRMLGGRQVYYGTADATPLFVALAGELVRWGHLDAVTPLLDHVDRALEWITTQGDRDRDGFVEYETSSARGLRNQGWKDSPDSVTFADGTLADTPIALAEVQAYCYAAFRARAAIAAALGDEPARRRWSHEAAELRRRFDEAFWIPERGWYATALDGSKRQVDALTSNLGHCLWTGIVPAARAAAVAAHLHGPNMFTGFGVRTLSTDMAAFDPVSYHNGSVWPHDTAICVAGLMRYGFHAAATDIAAGLLAASTSFGGRLPELFCGFGRSEFERPVPYPAACTPQAWAAAAPALLLRALLRLEPDAPAGVVSVDPHLLPAMLPFEVTDLAVGAGFGSIAVDGHGAVRAHFTDHDLVVSDSATAGCGSA